MAVSILAASRLGSKSKAGTTVGKVGSWDWGFRANVTLESSQIHRSCLWYFHRITPTLRVSCPRNSDTIAILKALQQRQSCQHDTVNNQVTAQQAAMFIVSLTTKRIISTETWSCFLWWSQIPAALSDYHTAANIWWKINKRLPVSIKITVELKSIPVETHPESQLWVHSLTHSESSRADRQNQEFCPCLPKAEQNGRLSVL